MHVVELIRSKRDGGTHTREEIEALVRGCTDGSIPDYQLSAWLMAVFHRGMEPGETVALTEAMLHSGAVMDWSDVPGIKVDKHSTGGVGDKTSLVIAPVVAAAGVPVPMISGRALGHTGGTLDKLESIPGFRVGLSLQEFRDAVEKIGCGLIGQTNEIAPADRRLYGLRDVTSTVESIPLITGSILSKKLAEGIDALVLDVKVGSGAFMKSREDARRLAASLQTIGTRMGKKVVALLTGMDEPLGCAIGNSLEVAEAIDVLHGRGPADLRELCRELSAWMLVLGDGAADLVEGRAINDRMIAEGKAAGKFEEIIENQGGDAGVVRDPTRLPQASHGHEVTAMVSGLLDSVDAEQVGRAAMQLGAGRERAEDVIDPAAGIIMRKKVGDAVEKGEPLAVFHCIDDARFPAAQERFLAAVKISDGPRDRPPLVLETLT